MGTNLWVPIISEHCPDLAPLARRTAILAGAYKTMYGQVMQLPEQEIMHYRQFLLNMAHEVANDFAIMMDLGLQQRLESGIYCFGVLPLVVSEI